MWKCNSVGCFHSPKGSYVGNLCSNGILWFLGLNTKQNEKNTSEFFEVQMTKICISVSLLQLKQHYFKDHTAENRMQKFQLVSDV